MADSLDKDPPMALRRPFSLIERATWPTKKFVKTGAFDREKLEESVVIFGDPADVSGEPLAKQGWFEAGLLTIDEHDRVIKKFGWIGDKRFTTFLDCLDGTARTYWLEVVADHYTPGGNLRNEDFADALDKFVDKVLDYPDSRDVLYEAFRGEEFKKDILMPPKNFLLRMKEMIRLGKCLPEGDQGDLSEKMIIYLFARAHDKSYRMRFRELGHTYSGKTLDEVAEIFQNMYMADNSSGILARRAADKELRKRQREYGQRARAAARDDRASKGSHGRALKRIREGRHLSREQQSAFRQRKREFGDRWSRGGPRGRGESRDERRGTNHDRGNDRSDNQRRFARGKSNFRDRKSQHHGRGAARDGRRGRREEAHAVDDEPAEDDERSAASEAGDDDREEDEVSDYEDDGSDYDEAHAVDMVDDEEDGKVPARDVRRELRRIDEDLGEMSPDRYSALGKSRVRTVRRYTGEEPRRPTRRELADERRLLRRSDRQSEADKRRCAKSRAEGKARARRADSEATDSEKRKVKARFQQAGRKEPPELARKPAPRAERDTDEALAFDDGDQHSVGELAAAAGAAAAEEEPLDAERQQDDEGKVTHDASAGPGFSSSDEGAILKGSRSF